MSNYSHLKGFIKGVKYLVLAGLAGVVNYLPQLIPDVKAPLVGNVSGETLMWGIAYVLIVYIYNQLKVKWGIKLP